ncbi:hypothetical protein CCHL11_00238 [Colletotrichum chlorophyti]|uniref:Uncharacterized protein n=1 Tax=Colletotrichum chlorophyti TaxID=708187 RepID=A0A1Q8RUM5_9PEZI|nr:hypothetical protein CCHL11_00238 [Colletotrichum chlorophyti]
MEPAVKLTEIGITPQDIDLLGHYFSTKTMFDVKLGCNEEARQILEASLTDTPIRQAVSSLRALREHLEASGEVAAPVARRTPGHSYDYGLQQYCKALGGLASRLSYPGPDELRSALLCCQVFISIEQVKGNYGAMAQHIVQGLGVLRNCRVRSQFAAADAAIKFAPAYHGRMPLLDVFIVKLFAAPCKFADPPAPTISDMGETKGAGSDVSPHAQLAGLRKPHVRTIAPDMRTELTRIAATTLEFLDRVSHVESPDDALRLLFDKASLLDSLESWLSDLELVLADVGPHQPEPLSLSFLRLFHQILKIVLLGALHSSPDEDAKLQIEIGRLYRMASFVEEGFKAYRIRSEVRSGRGEPPKVLVR